MKLAPRCMCGDYRVGATSDMQQAGRGRCQLTTPRGLRVFALIRANVTNNRLPAAVLSAAVSFDGRGQKPVFCDHNGNS